MKPVLQQDELIEFIKNNKKIVFENSFEKEDMKLLLNTYNYLNIFSLKYFLLMEKANVQMKMELIESHILTTMLQDISF